MTDARNYCCWINILTFTLVLLTTTVVLSVTVVFYMEAENLYNRAEAVIEDSEKATQYLEPETLQSLVSEAVSEETDQWRQACSVSDEQFESTGEDVRQTTDKIKDFFKE